MDLLLTDKTVLITGASGGIGRAMARAFAAEGARLVLLGHRRFAELERFAADEGFGERALCLRADVTVPGELDAAFEKTEGTFGRVDACMANAGVWPAEDRGLVTLDVERVRRTIEIDLLGAVWTARAFLQSLGRTGPRADGHGACLVFTGSTAARFGERGHSDYATSKAGLYGLMRSLKNEVVDLDPWARVNVVEPGWTVTEMTRKEVNEPGMVERTVRTMPLRQLGRAADVARAAVVLASPAASRHVSGQVVTVAGGMEGRVRWEQEQVDGDLARRRLAPED